MLSWSPDEIGAMQDALSPAMSAAAITGLPANDVESFLAIVYEFIKANYARLGAQPFMLVLAGNANGKGKSLSLAQLKGFVSGQRRCIWVDARLRVVKAESTGDGFMYIANLTKQQKTVGVRSSGSHSCTFAGGFIVDEQKWDGSSTAVNSQWHRPLADFELLAADHFAERIRNEGIVSYWHDRKARILRSKPDGTEAIFHTELFWWLKAYVLDKISVSGEMKGLGQNKVDIFVTTAEGAFVIEVKWMGKNETKTVYGMERVDEGLVQIAKYINDDRELMGGYVVAYDGRAQGEPTQHDDSHRHPLCAKPIIHWLESETASEIAKVTIRKKKAHDKDKK